MIGHARKNADSSAAKYGWPGVEIALIGQNRCDKIVYS